ncbi:MAG TPA: RyR domain-containing protein, partial [Azospirillum sp.]
MSRSHIAAAFLITAIARVCHEVNRALCVAFGDLSQKPWDEAESWQRESAIRGVEFALANPDAPPSAQHDAWMADKLADGWVYGEVKDPAAKTHPCIVPYDQLP